MADYTKYSARALKKVLPDGSEGVPENFVITQVIVPPNEKGAAEYKRYSAEADKYLMPDGSEVVGEFINDGGGNGSSVNSVNSLVGNVVLNGTNVFANFQNVYNPGTFLNQPFNTALGMYASYMLDLNNNKTDYAYVDFQDSQLQTQIDNLIISSKTDYVRSTYADLLLVTNPKNGEYANVVVDETHDNLESVYKYNGSTWVYQGSVQPTYTKGETDGKLALKADKSYVDAQDNLKVSKSGDTMTGTLKFAGANVPIEVAAEFAGTPYAPLFVATAPDSNGIPRTAYEAYFDKSVGHGSLNYKVYNPVTTGSIIFELSPNYTRPNIIIGNISKPMALLEDVGTPVDFGKRMVVKNITDTAVPNTGSVLTNVVSLVSTKNDISGATLNNNVITLPVGSYEITATLNIIKTAGSSIVEVALISDEIEIPESTKYASWGNGTAGPATFPYMGNIDVVESPLLFNVGILAGTTNVTYHTVENKISAVVLDIKKVG